MSSRLVLADERYAVCTVCREKKRLVFNKRHDVGEPAEAPGFSPAHSRLMPFERRCLPCSAQHRALLASFTARRVRAPRTEPLWAAVEDGALHAAVDLLQKARASSGGGAGGALSRAGDFDRERGRTALHCALLSTADAYTAGLVVDGTTVPGSALRFEAVCLLLEAGADANAGTVLGRDRPLAMAAARGDKRLVEALLAYGADVERVDKHGRSCLHSASSVDVVHILVREGVSTSARDKEGCTALQAALRAGDDETRIKLLMRLGERRRNANEVWAKQAQSAEAERRRGLDVKREASIAAKAHGGLVDKVARAKDNYDKWRRAETVDTAPSPVSTADAHYAAIIADRRAKRQAAEEEERRGGGVAGAASGAADA